MNQLCQNQFGVTAHQCTAGEYFSTAGAKSGIQSKWVEPSVSNCVSSATSPSGVLCQVPTISDGSFIDPSPWVLKCGNWVQDTNSYTGAAAVEGADTYAHLSIDTTCDTKLPVACCAP
jgi:hypothetical protein